MVLSEEIPHCGSNRSKNIKQTKHKNSETTKNMKHQIKPRKDSGFSLVEMLVVIAVIGILAAISVSSIGAISDKAKTAKSQRNAQNICQLYSSARSVGATFNTTDKAEILNQLIAGKTGPQLAGSSFKMSNLSAEEKTAALAYCSFDASADAMRYDPSGGQTAEVASNVWGDYSPQSSGSVYVGAVDDSSAPNGAYDYSGVLYYSTEAEAQALADQLAVAFPGQNFITYNWYQVSGTYTVIEN